jgi:hypothetical protein
MQDAEKSRCANVWKVSKRGKIRGEGYARTREESIKKEPKMREMVETVGRFAQFGRGFRA